MTIAVGSTTFQIPVGYQGVVRGVTIIPSVVISEVDATGATPIEFLMSFLSEGGGVKQNTQRSIRLIEGNNEFPLFFTVPENAIITMALETDQDVFSTPGDGFNCTIVLHVNLIVDDGRPDNYIVSSKEQELL